MLNVELPTALEKRLAIWVVQVGDRREVYR